MSLDVTIIYKKPKMVKYNATHAACGSTFMIVPDDVPIEETEWSANITHNMSRMALQVPICVKLCMGAWREWQYYHFYNE